jgi:hypothetical protein
MFTYLATFTNKLILELFLSFLISSQQESSNVTSLSSIYKSVIETLIQACFSKKISEKEGI